MTSDEEKFLKLVESKKYHSSSASMSMAKNGSEIDGQEMYGETPAHLYKRMMSPDFKGQVHLSYFIKDNYEPDLWIDATKVRALAKKKRKIKRRS